MDFEKVVVKGATANLAKREITLTFTVPLDEQTTAEELMEYQGKGCRLKVLPRQSRMQFETGLRRVGEGSLRADRTTGEVIPGDDNEG